MSNTLNNPFLQIPIPLPPLIWCPNIYQPVSNSTNRYITLMLCGVKYFSASSNSRFTPHSIDDILRPNPRTLESSDFKTVESPLNLSLSKGKYVGHITAKKSLYYYRTTQTSREEKQKTQRLWPWERGLWGWRRYQWAEKDANNFYREANIWIGKKFRKQEVLVIGGESRDGIQSSGHSAAGGSQLILINSII